MVLKTTTQREEGLLLLQSNLLLPPVHTARQGHDMNQLWTSSDTAALFSASEQCKSRSLGGLSTS